MTDTMTDPFATTNTSDDPFATPTTDFTVIDDLDGRLVAIVGLRMAVGVSKQSGKEYDKVIADVIVIDGPTTDKIPSLPYTISEMHLMAGMVVGQIRQYVGKGTPVLGRVNSKPSSYNRSVKAFGLGDPTDQDKGKALPAYRAYVAAKANDAFARS